MPGDNPMKCDLTGKVSVVTGAARGIGKAIADRLAANGSDVYYTDRDAEEVRAAAGGRRWLRLDVTSPDDLAAARQHIDAEVGRLDVLVNNAGVHLRTACRSTSFMGPYRGRGPHRGLRGQSGIYRPRAAAGARIINIASVAGWCHWLQRRCRGQGRRH